LLLSERKIGKRPKFLRKQIRKGRGKSERGRKSGRKQRNNEDTRMRKEERVEEEERM
jgi:hypothetical protein